MTHLEELYHELAKTDLQISDLTQRRKVLEQQLQETRNSETQALFDSWNLTTESKVILFAKNINSCYQTIVTLEPTNINVNEHVFISREGHYFLQMDPCFRSMYVQHEFSYLFKLKDSFNVYFVDEQSFTEIIEVLCSLQITNDNCRDYEECIAERAICRIS